MRSVDHVEYTYTTGMPDEELAERLHEESFGVLSLARDDESYAIPVAFHYDGERILLRLSDDGNSEKVRFLDSTERASLLLYAAPGERDSWSILVRGLIRSLPEEEQAGISDAEINEWFAPFRVFDESIEDVEVRLYELDPDTMTGRQTMEPEE